MKKTTYLLIIIMVSQNIFAQKIIRQSLSCMGSSNSAKTCFIQQTIGQSSNTSIIRNGNTCVRQGFLQSLHTFYNSGSQPININLNVFPNPVNDNFTLRVSGSDSAFIFSVTDMLGRIILTSAITGNNQQTINTDSWNNGLYFVSIYYKNQLKAINKIIKLK